MNAKDRVTISDSIATSGAGLFQRAQRSARRLCAVDYEQELISTVLRFTSDKTPFTDLEELTATVKRNGKTHGPFTGRMTMREPGLVATQHIFTSAGEYEATLTFKKKGDATVHSITFPFKIADRKTLEIP